MRFTQITILTLALLLPHAVFSQRPTKSIRSIDFKNFTYPVCMDIAVLSTARSTSLKGGELEVGDLRKHEEPVNIALSNVSYYDLTGDGKEEAIVSLTYLLYPHGAAGCTFIYRLKRGRPQLVWRHSFGGGSFGGLRKLAVETGNLRVEEYLHSEADAYCCAEKFNRSFYRWQGGRFRKIKSKVFANDYADARFLGYP